MSESFGVGVARQGNPGRFCSSRFIFASGSSSLCEPERRHAPCAAPSGKSPEFLGAGSQESTDAAPASVRALIAARSLFEIASRDRTRVPEKDWARCRRNRGTLELLCRAC